MHKHARHMVTAYLATLTLLILPATATAAPARDSISDPAWSPTQHVDELVTWVAGWFEQSPIQSISARGGHTIDPDGSESPALDDGGTVTTQGGHTVDPDG